MSARAAILSVLASIVAIASALADDARAPRSADAILNQYCNVCHLTGWNGAPLSGEPDDWQARRTAGFATLFKNAKQGLNSMPPLGTCTDCTDEELQAAIREMLP
jgi:cytochrome c5